MMPPLRFLSTALVLCPTVLAIALPAPAPQDDTSSSANALSVLCAALSGTSLPSACLPTTATSSAVTTSVTGSTASSATITSTGSQAITSAGSQTTAASAGTTISAPAACTSGAIPNDSTKSCWADMGLEDYVTNWWNDNQDSCDNTAAQGSARSFANCWYKLMVAAESPTNCDVLNTGTSCAKPSWKDFSGDNMEANFWVSPTILSSRILIGFALTNRSRLV